MALTTLATSEPAHANGTGDAVGNFGGASGITKGTAANTSNGSLGTAGVMMLNAPTIQSFAFSNGTENNQMQYSASTGQTNSFNVGANNNAGINSSVQSTQEYNGSSSASLTLAAGCTTGCEQSVLTNVIGVAEQGFNTSSRSQSWAAAAEASASASVGASYEAAKGRGYSGTEQQYQAEYKAKYDVAYAAAATSASSSSSGVQNSTGVVGGTFNSTTSGSSSSGTTGSGSMSSQSTVELKGIGAESTVAAGADSTFKTDITRNANVTGTSDMASAQAGAGLTLGTTANASSNASSFSSVFVSAF